MIGSGSSSPTMVMEDDLEIELKEEEEEEEDLGEGLGLGFEVFFAIWVEDLMRAEARALARSALPLAVRTMLRVVV